MNTPTWLIVADFIDEHGFSDVADEMRRIAHGTIYVVTTGSYSDYSVRGLFLTKEAAEACRAELAKGQYTDPNDVEEYTLDALAGHVTTTSWTVDIDCKGNLHRQRESTEFGEAGGSRAEVVTESEGSPAYANAFWQSRPDYSYMAKPYLSVHSWVSQEHADKVAIEQYQRRLMDGRWPPADRKPEPDHEFVPTDSGRCGACGHLFSHWKHWEK